MNELGYRQLSLAMFASLALHVAALIAYRAPEPLPFPDPEVLLVRIAELAPEPVAPPPVAPPEPIVEPPPPPPEPVVEPPPPPPPPKPVVAKPVPKPPPAPPKVVRQPTPPAPAPVAKVAPKADPVVRLDYKQLLLAALERQKDRSYPVIARRRRMEGAARVRFSVNRAGAVVSLEMVDPARYEMLTRAALDMVRRAEPFPPMPEGVPGETFELTAEIAFKVQ